MQIHALMRCIEPQICIYACIWDEGGQRGLVLVRTAIVEVEGRGERHLALLCNRPKAPEVEGGGERHLGGGSWSGPGTEVPALLVTGRCRSGPFSRFNADPRADALH